MIYNQNNILIIGNGFDLAHNLKTSYHDFMDYLIELKSKPELSQNENELRNIASDNKFIKCFLSNYKNTNNTWIDFEKEIKNIALTIDEYCINDNYYSNGAHRNYSSGNQIIFINERVHNIFTIFDLYNINEYKDNKYGIVWIKIEEMIKSEFENLKKCLCLYLQIQNSKLDDDSKLLQISLLNPSYILSFNYTNTLFLYLNEKLKYCFVHGNAEDNNRIVLGFESTVKFKNNNIDFSFLYKDVQRILYKIDDKLEHFKVYSIPFMKSAQNSILEKPIIHIYGMSLDKTDSNYIKMFFDEKYSQKIVIYYYNKGDKLSSFSGKERLTINLLNNFDYNERNKILARIEKEEIVFEPVHSNSDFQKLLS